MTRLADVVQASARVAATPSRLAKIAELSGCLRRVDPDEIEIAITYLSGDIPQGRLSVPFSLLHKTPKTSTVPSLSLRDVDSAFRRLKETKGAGSAARKEEILNGLFEKATPEEHDFIVRLIVGELRQGALEGIMVDALAAAASLPPAAVRRAVTFAGGIAPVARAALTEGGRGLERFTVELMRPVLPMLAQPAEDVEAALATLGTAALDWKLDGARVQVHKAGDEVRVFTRSLKEVTSAVPEVVESVGSIKAGGIILDGEAIALRADGKPQPFQVTMTRFGRKAHDESTRRELPLSVFFFDCLLADGEVLVDRPWRERRAFLERIFSKENLTPAIVTADTARAAAFYADALAHGHEGVMAKAPDSAYEAGRRGGSWLKVKSAHTLDLVVLAVEWGRGRRSGWLSNLHLGARDPDGGFVMLGKTFKGMTDEILEWQTAELLKRETRREGNVVYVRPELVVEIAFNDIQKSPHYPGGMALRFARLKGYRPDKRADEADTIGTVRALFEHQK